MTADGAKVMLSVRGLRTWFELRRFGFARVGFVRAVDDVSFDLRRKEAAAFVGESGCGKSSLAKTVLGLYKPHDGEIIFDGEPLDVHNSERMARYRSQIGYIQQDPYGALPPFLDVRRILAEPLIIQGVRSKKERERRIHEVLGEVKLLPVDDFLSKFPHMLSGGQQQRVVVARAMIMRPKLLVADEPVSMLDASVRVEILHLLRNLQRTHDLTVIYITHDLSTVRHFSERAFVMYAGKVVETAPVDDLLAEPMHPYSKALLGAIADPDPKNAHCFRKVPPGEPPSLLNPPPGCSFHPRCAAAIEGLCDTKTPRSFEPRPRHLSACWLQSGEEEGSGADEPSNEGRPASDRRGSG